MDTEADFYRQSIPELIASLKTAFRASDFERVKHVWLAREHALKEEIEITEEKRQLEMLENIRMNREIKSLKRKPADLEKKLADLEESRLRSRQELGNVDADDDGVLGGSNGIVSADTLFGPERHKRKRTSSVNAISCDDSAAPEIKKVNREVVTCVSIGGLCGHQESVPAKINGGESSTHSRVNKVFCGQSEDKTEETSDRQTDSVGKGTLSSDSDDNTDYSFVFSVPLRKDKAGQGHRNWETEAQMIASFGEDLELCLKAICLLYRQQNSEIVSCGFNEHDTIRGSALAEFLTDGNPEGEPKKSATDLAAYDQTALWDCRRIALQHSEQLFEMYQAQGDSAFFI